MRAADDGYLAELQQRAITARLADDPQWLRLLHARPDRLGRGHTSTVTFDAFFLSPRGRTDPAAELAATLASLFSDPPRDGEPAQCRVKARYEWLRARLDFDASRLPESPCERFDEWVARLDPQVLALVFASNDLNSPSSMFGHTLLRVDARGQGDDDRLLAYAVNYAADTGNAGALAYAVRGIGGAFVGSFSIHPYYDKVKEYARYEHRDLWEYPLALDAPATHRLLTHLWEMRGVGFDYYFFTQNCSYQLLSLLEAARPDLRLTAAFDGWAPYTIPIDTIRLLRADGLLGAPVYRPALAQQLRWHFAALPEAQQQWVLDYASGRAGLDDPRLVNASPVVQARMLEICPDYLYFQFQNDAVGRGDGLARSRAALVMRAGIAAEAEFAPVPRPAVSPDAGHGSGRFSVGGRVDDDGHAAALLRWRPAYHDRLDPPGGYLAGGELAFLDTGFVADDDGLRLQELRLLSVQAVAPREVAFRPWSWQVSTGARRYRLPDAGAHGALGAYVDGGGGLGWAPGRSQLLYLFAFGEADVNDDARRGYAVSLGPRLGWAGPVGARFSQQWQADALAGVAGEQHATLRLGWSGQWHLDAQNGLRLGLSLQQRDDASTGLLQLAWQRYF